jgi:maltose O-acetyltransferase
MKKKQTLIKKIIRKLINVDHIKQFYYPFDVNKIKLRLVKSKFKYLGNRTYLDFPIKIKGKEYVSIGNDVVINSFVHIWGHGGVHIGDRVMIAAHTSITSLTHDYSDNMRFNPAIKNKVVIEDDVWIGSNVIILPGITIKKGAVIGAGSVVTKNIDEYCIAYGNPAKVVKKRTK